MFPIFMMRVKMGGNFILNKSSSLHFNIVIIPFVDEMLLQEDLIEILPAIGEANSISEELDKKKKFEVMLVSGAARGDPKGRTQVRVDCDGFHIFFILAQLFCDRAVLQIWRRRVLKKSLNLNHNFHDSTVTFPNLKKERQNIKHFKMQYSLLTWGSYLKAIIIVHANPF